LVAGSSLQFIPADTKNNAVFGGVKDDNNNLPVIRTAAAATEEAAAAPTGASKIKPQ
jgi:hypothetical protein